MPQQILPDAITYTTCKKYLETYGFIETDTAGLLRRFPRREPPGHRQMTFAFRSRKAAEKAFLFEANGLAVIVWTTWTVAGARESDAGWVLITDAEGFPKYFSRPVHRTKYFIERLVNYAWIARFRVLHRPSCSLCGESMHIVRGRGLKSRYWRCLNPAHKGEGPSADFDQELPPRAQKFLIRERDRRRAYREVRTKQGKENFIALKKRAKRKEKLQREEVTNGT